jgi:hypothetical protein
MLDVILRSELQLPDWIERAFSIRQLHSIMMLASP